MGEEISSTLPPDIQEKIRNVPITSQLNDELAMCEQIVSMLERVTPFARKRILEFAANWYNEKNAA